MSGCACAFCGGDRTALHAESCPMRLARSTRRHAGWTAAGSEVGRALRTAGFAHDWADWRLGQCDVRDLAEPERMLLRALGREP